MDPGPTPAKSMSARRRQALAALALLALCAIFHGPAVGGGFVWDDDDYVERNETLRSAEGLRRIWFDLEATPQYYPLVHTTYWLEYRLWGLDPAGYHATNILLHAAASVLLWRVLLLMGIPGAWFAAAIFGVHPVHVESVAWITERKNVLSAVFMFASALLYLRFSLGDRARRGPRRVRAEYAGALLLFVAALLSKTVACTLPVLLLMVIWWRRGGMTRREVLSLAPFLAIGLVLGLLTVYLERHHVEARGADWDLSPAQRCLIAGRAVFFYAGKLDLTTSRKRASGLPHRPRRTVPGG